MMVRIVVRIVERMLLIVMLSLPLLVIEIIGWDGLGWDAIGWRERRGAKSNIPVPPKKKKITISIALSAIRFPLASA